MTIGDNLEDKNGYINKDVRQEKSKNALKLEDDKGYMNKKQI